MLFSVQDVANLRIKLNTLAIVEGVIDVLARGNCVIKKGPVNKSRIKGKLKKVGNLTHSRCLDRLLHQ